MFPYTSWQICLVWRTDHKRSEEAQACYVTSHLAMFCYALYHVLYYKLFYHVLCYIIDMYYFTSVCYIIGMCCVLFGAPSQPTSSCRIRITLKLDQIVSKSSKNCILLTLLNSRRTLSNRYQILINVFKNVSIRSHCCPTVTYSVNFPMDSVWSQLASQYGLKAHIVKTCVQS